MSCDECDRAERNGLVAYFRWGSANIGLIGCPMHLKEIMEVLREFQRKKEGK